MTIASPPSNISRLLGLSAVGETGTTSWLSGRSTYWIAGVRRQAVNAASGRVAEGAKRAGRDPSEVEVATLMPCAVGSSGEGAIEGLKSNIARYAAHFPRYRRLMENAGFTEELQAVRRAWNEGDQEEAIRLVPSELIDKIALVGSGEQCRAKLDEYRRAGITQPIISPRVSGDNPKEEAMQIIRACAPR